MAEQEKLESNPDPVGRDTIEAFLASLGETQAYQELGKTNPADTQQNPPSSESPISTPTNFPLKDGGKIHCPPLWVSSAVFDLRLNLESNDPTALLHYPSRMGELNPPELLDYIENITEAAYPGRNLTPVAVLKGEGRDGRNHEFSYDLKNYFHGRLYENALKNPGLTSITYCLEVDIPISMPLNSSSSRAPDFIFGLHLSGSRVDREFVQMSHFKARVLGPELPAELLRRSRDYPTGGNLLQDSEDLAKQIRDVCENHPSPPPERIF